MNETEKCNAGIIKKIRFILDKTNFDDGEKIFNILFLINQSIDDYDDKIGDAQFPDHEGSRKALVAGKEKK